MFKNTLVEYINSKLKVKIICPEHGIFEQNASSHCLGHGCLKCSKNIKRSTIKKTKKQFIIDANKKHNNKYDYSLIEYINSKLKVKIICPEHGIFEQTPNNHLNGNRCPKCKRK